MKRKRSKLSAVIGKGNYEEIVRNILVDFSTIVDTDLGVIIYLMANCPDSKYFKKECQNWSFYFTQCKVLTRSDCNPITVLLKDEFTDQADNLYKELIESKWQEVLKVSPVTDSSKVLYSMYDYAGYKVTVKCRNEAEKSFIEEFAKGWKTLIGDENPNSYSCFFIHNLDERAPALTGVMGKSFYIYYHKPNLLNFKEGLLKETAAGIIGNNIKLIEPYKGLTLPYDMTPDDMEVKLNGKEYSTERNQSGNECSE